MRVCVRDLPETEASLRAHELALTALDEAQALDAAGERIRAVELIAEMIDDYCARTELLQCPSSTRALMQLGRRAVEWSDVDSFSRATLARIEAMRGLYPPTSEAWSEAQMSLCQVYTRHGDTERAAGACEESLRVALECFPPGHRNRPIVRFATAQSFHAARDLERALELFQQAVDEARASDDFDPLRLALMQSELGACLSDTGQFAAVLAQHRGALAVVERLLPPDHDYTLDVLGNMAVVLSSMGEKSRALEVHERRCALFAARLAPENIEFIHARGNRAVVRLAMGDAQRAATELEEVMACFERSAYAGTERGDLLCVNLAQAWIATGRAAAALERLERQIDERARAGRRDASMSWRLESTAAHALQTLGRDGEALARAEQALALAERAFPWENPDLAESRQRAAALRTKVGAKESARALAEQSALQTQAYFARCAELLTMQDAERAQQHWSRLVSDGVTLLDATCSPERRAENDRAVFELCEGARAIGTSLLRSWRARASGDESRLEPLRQAAVRAARDVARSAADRGAPEQLEAALAARRRAEEALREALEDSAERERAPSVVDSVALARSLSEDEALLAYWRLDQRELAPPEGAPRSARLCAFVLRADGRLLRHDLGELSGIADACRAWQRAARGDGGDVRACGERLRQLVLDPLRASLAGATRWRVALDDELHSIALDALPAGAEREPRVGDSVQVVMVSAAAPGSPRTSSAALSAARKLVAVGGVDYESSETESPPALGGSAASARFASGLRPTFEPLWDTQDEIEGVARLFRAADGARGEPASAAWSCVLLSEREATRARLLEAVRQADFVHVATHGFFAPEHTGDDALNDLLARRSPLTLCGLALAGANDPTNTDGLITADELALLDLRRCELVVLSACDTNVGERSAGQGVASFQKALHAAGARSVVTSLWKVDDSAARELMLALYRGLWNEHLEAAEALWRAKRELRERRAPERDWAGWVLSSQ